MGDKLNHEKIVLTVLCICMSFAFYGMYLQNHYSLDSYGMVHASGWPLFQMLSHGRPFFDIVMYGMFRLGFNPMGHQAFFAVLLILVIAFAVAVMYFKAMERLGKESSMPVKAVVFIACNIAFLNFCFQEWFNFSDGMVQFIGGLFFVVIAVRAILENKWIKTFAFLYIALGFYQAVLGVFISWALLLFAIPYIKEECRLREYARQAAILLLAAASASICNVLTTKLAETLHLVGKVLRSVKFSPGLLLENCKKILDAQCLMFQKGYYHMPDYFLLAVMAMLLVCLAVFMVIRKKYIQAAVTLSIVTVSYSSAYLPFLLSETVSMPPRTLIAIFSSLSAAAIFCAAASQNCHGCQIARIFCGSICGLAVFAVLAVNYVHVQKETLDLFATNELDYYICQQIGYKINQYEQESGQAVDTIQWHTDTSYAARYPHVTTNAFDTNCRAFNVVWSWYGLYEYTLGRTFYIEEMPEEEYSRLFAGKNWDYFIPDECIIFEDNVMYFIIN